MGKKTGEKTKLSTDPYKGVRDFYPEDQAVFAHIARTMREVVERFGFEEYNASILEPSELYKSKGVENEEIVNEQTYTFTDRGEREVTLRPEMTPTVARMVAGRRRELGWPLRWYSIANFFRYERPQRGRLREFWQLNVDIFGSKSFAADAEIIAVAHDIMLALGASETDFIIKLGSRSYLDMLIQENKLDDAQAKKLRGLLDRRNKISKEEFEKGLGEVGVSADLLATTNVPQDVEQVLELLREMGVGNAAFDPSIVRGFDYYTGVVFELYDTHPENTRALFGGGRYDNLLALFDAEAVPAVGAAAGDETLKNFLESHGLLPQYLPNAEVYIAVVTPEYVAGAISLANTLRKASVAVSIDFGEKKLADQIKTASKHHIPSLIVVGEDELKNDLFKIKNLETGEETALPKNELSAYFSNQK
jgi:histidyl-tRNA synthetase